MEIQINKKQCDYLEALQYNLERTKEIVAYMLTNNYDTHTDAFKAWDKDNQEDYIKYQTAKAEIEKEYIYNRPEFRGKKASWRLDFETAVLTAEAADAEKD